MLSVLFSLMATSLNNLALAYERQGKYEATEPLLLRGYTIFEKVLGAEHPDTKDTLGKLVELYEKTGETEKAAEFRAKQVN